MEIRENVLKLSKTYILSYQSFIYLTVNSYIGNIHEKKEKKNCSLMIKVFCFMAGKAKFGMLQVICLKVITCKTESYISLPSKRCINCKTNTNQTEHNDPSGMLVDEQFKVPFSN